MAAPSAAVVRALDGKPTRVDSGDVDGGGTLAVAITAAAPTDVNRALVACGLAEVRTRSEPKGPPFFSYYFAFRFACLPWVLVGRSSSKTVHTGAALRARYPNRIPTAPRIRHRRARGGGVVARRGQTAIHPRDVQLINRLCARNRRRAVRLLEEEFDLI